MQDTESVGDENFDNLQQEKELQELRKQIRQTDRDLSALKDDTKKKLLRDTKEIKLLEMENEYLKTDLENAESGKYSRQDTWMIEKLRATVDEGEKVQEEIDQELIKQEKIHAERKQLEKKINQERRVSAVAGRRGGQRPSGLKSAKALEGRLEKANSDFSNKLKVNSQLRNEIETLRKDYAIFNKMHGKLNDVYKQTKEERDELMDETRDAQKQREEASNKRRSLEERNEEEKRQYELEMQNQRRIITHFTNFRSFVNKKCENIDERRKAAEEERHEKARQKRARSAKERLEEYEKAFSRIGEITGDEDIDAIVEQFLNNDAKLYSEFTFVADLESQIGTLENKVEGLREKNKTIKALSDKEDIAYEKQMEEVEERHRKMKNLNDELASQAETASERMATVLARVKDVYQRVAPKNDALMKLFASDEGNITERNVHLYLSELEMKIDRLISVSKYLARKDNKPTTEEECDDMLPPKTPLGYIEYFPEIRSDDDGDDRDDAQPLSLEEIRERIFQKDNRSEEPAERSSPTEKLSESEEEVAPLYEF